MNRFVLALIVVAVAGLAACRKPPSPEMLAKLQGGTTTVVVYGFCIPMDYLIKTAMTRQTLTFMVNEKPVGKMKSCSFATFRVPSGYWSAQFKGGFGFGNFIHERPYHPGKTQYLHLSPSGNNWFSARWVTKAEADAGIAEIRKIGQFF